MRFDQANVKGRRRQRPRVGSRSRHRDRALQPEFAAGDLQTLAGLGDDEIMAASTWAEDQGFELGDTLQVTTPAGRTIGYELVGLYDNQVGTLGQILVTNASMSKDWNQPDDAFILVGGRVSPRRWRAPRRPRSRISPWPRPRPSPSSRTRRPTR
jgi:hypothetical protein